MRQDVNNNPETLLKQLREITLQLKNLKSLIEEKTNQPNNSNLPRKVILCLLSVYLNPSFQIFTMTSVFLFVEFKYRQHLNTEKKSDLKLLSSSLNQSIDKTTKIIDTIYDYDNTSIPVQIYNKGMHEANEPTTSYIEIIDALLNIIDHASKHLEAIQPAASPTSKKVGNCCTLG